MAVTARPERPPAPTERPAQTSDQNRPTPGEAWSPEAAAEVRQAGKQFDKNWVVRNLDLKVDCGEIFGIFGPSGSGKTTTIRLLLGLLRPDEGEIRVLGTTPRKFGARTRARIGYMPQLFVLYPELSVQENLHLVASLYGLGWLRRRRLMRE